MRRNLTKRLADFQSSQLWRGFLVNLLDRSSGLLRSVFFICRLLKHFGNVSLYQLCQSAPFCQGPFRIDRPGATSTQHQSFEIEALWSRADVVNCIQALVNAWTSDFSLQPFRIDWCMNFLSWKPWYWKDGRQTSGRLGVLFAYSFTIPFMGHRWISIWSGGMSYGCWLNSFANHFKISTYMGSFILWFIDRVIDKGFL